MLILKDVKLCNELKHHMKDYNISENDIIFSMLNIVEDEYLTDKQSDCLEITFIWSSHKKGHEYWEELFNKEIVATKEYIDDIRDIFSYYVLDDINPEDYV